jgi:hypothetical protein
MESPTETEMLGAKGFFFLKEKAGLDASSVGVANCTGRTHSHVCSLSDV